MTDPNVADLPPNPLLDESKSLPVHVVSCNLRYGQIFRRLQRLEYIIWALLVILLLNGEGPITDLIVGLVK